MKMILITAFFNCLLQTGTAQMQQQSLRQQKPNLSTRQWLYLQTKAAVVKNISDKNAQSLFLKSYAGDAATAGDPCIGINYGCSTVVVPVTQLELSGIRINEDQVRLNWKTFTEINNKGFNIERRLGFSGNFSFIQFVPGAGNSQTERFYDLMDNNNYKGTSYYRLKQTDWDGKFSYSNTVAVKGYNKLLTVTPFPNPATADKLNFQVTGTKPGTSLSVSVYDNTGKTVYRNERQLLSLNYTFSLKNNFVAAPGLYHVIVYTADEKANGSFLIH